MSETRRPFSHWHCVWPFSSSSGVCSSLSLLLMVQLWCCTRMRCNPVPTNALFRVLTCIDSGDTLSRAWVKKNSSLRQTVLSNLSQCAPPILAEVRASKGYTMLRATLEYPTKVLCASVRVRFRGVQTTTAYIAKGCSSTPQDLCVADHLDGTACSDIKAAVNTYHM
jgi:hypothetical protein